jgi:hypothetical protein
LRIYIHTCIHVYCAYIHKATKPWAISVTNNIIIVSLAPRPPNNFPGTDTEPLVSAVPAAARSWRKDKLVIRSGVLPRSEVTTGFLPSRGEGAVLIKSLNE